MGCKKKKVEKDLPMPNNIFCSGYLIIFLLIDIYYIFNTKNILNL